MSGLAAWLLLMPGTPLDRMWEINPRARAELASLGGAGIVLLGAVSMACGAACRGLWVRRDWGRRLAIALLGVNLVGNAVVGFLRSDPRMLIGLPIGGAFLGFLLSRRVRQHFPQGGLPT